MPAKILIVDDDLNVQRLLTYTVRQEGYEVITANDGAEAFRLWSTERPDLVLLDVMLPKMDGYQVAQKIRAEEGPNHVPIIMLTAEKEVEQKVRGLRAGADDYLIKPFHPQELLARIKSLLVRNENLKAIAHFRQLGRSADEIRDRPWRPVPDKDVKSFAPENVTHAAPDNPEPDDSNIFPGAT